MTTFAESLKREIARLAKKELKGELTSLRKAVTNHRSEIAGLKRQLKALVSAQKTMVKNASQGAQALSVGNTLEPVVRRGRKRVFSAEAFFAKREALGITQAQMGKLVEASSLSVYKWESGQVTPRAAQLERIFAVMKMGKREAAAAIDN